MTRTMRRETNRLRAEIMDGLAEYLDDRDRTERLRLAHGRTAERISRCGTLVDEKAMPAHWLNDIVRACAPNMIFIPEFHYGYSRPQVLLH